MNNLDANSYKNWKSRDLFVEALVEKGITTDQTDPIFKGLEVLPSYTNGVQGKSECPWLNVIKLVAALIN
jgi:hypothetical protein